MLKKSVCIATYNGEKYIEEQLVSILKQLNDTDEIIISDDDSSDNTLNIITKLQDSRIKIYKNPKKGIISNFENALNCATGNYIFLCDQDDVWLPHKVETIMPYLKEYDLVVSDCKMVDKDLQVTERSFFKIMHSGPGFWKNFVKNTYLGCCMAFKKEILNYVLPFPSNIAMHDIWIGLSVEIHGKPFFLNEPLVLYRRHNNNASPSGGKSKYPLSYRIRYRYYILKELIKRKKEIKEATKIRL